MENFRCCLLPLCVYMLAELERGLLRTTTSSPAIRRRNTTNMMASISVNRQDKNPVPRAPFSSDIFTCGPEKNHIQLTTQKSTPKAKHSSTRVFPGFML